MISMKIYTEVLGNIRRSDEWRRRVAGLDVDEVFLDQWTAQKSRFLGKGLSGTEYPVALARHTQIADGDVIDFDPESGRAVVLRLELNPVLVVDLAGIADMDKEDVIRISLELGHAIGNQHWPAVVKGTKVYVPLTVDKKVMMSVLETHHIPGITFEFENGSDVIPYLAPHETRRLFGGAGHESHSHGQDPGHAVFVHDHGDGHIHCHPVAEDDCCSAHHVPHSHGGGRCCHEPESIH